jgi:hypothetical protein
MRFTFATTVLFLLLLLPVSGYNQTPAEQLKPCSLKLKQSPAVRGVKLGMKIEDLLEMFPGSADRSDIQHALSKGEGYPHFGVVGIRIGPGEYSTRARFEGIGSYSFLLVDGRVGEYQVQYMPPPSGPKWPRPDDFIAKLAATYELPPPANWTTDPNISAVKTLKCDGFQLKASTMNFQGVLTVAVAESPWTTQQERRTAYEENIRREFKP